MKLPATSSRADLTLDLVGPYRGECGICGGPDARHRLFDAIQEQQRAGDPSSLVAENYELPVELVERIAAAPRWREPRAAATRAADQSEDSRTT